MSSKPIKVSVLGMGMSATVFHIPFIKTLSNLFELHSILERSATATKSEARTRYGDQIKVVTTIEDILNDPEVQCVVVGTPNSTHYAYAKSILQAGKHVIIEKPLTPSAAEADELIQLAKSHSPPLIIATYQNRRFDSDFLTMAKLIYQGALGNISSFETRYDRWRLQLKGGTWKEQPGKGQGVLYDLGSHLIDQVLVLFGLPDRVSAHVYNSRRVGPDDFDDAFFGTFFYDSVPGSDIPLVVHLHASPLSAAEPQLRYSVKGTKGSFVKYGIDPQEDQLKLNPPMSTGDPAFGVEAEQESGILTTVQSDGTFIKEQIVSEHGRYLSWYENVGAALQEADSSRLYVKPEQAREVIRIIEFMYESSGSGKVLQVQQA
ncbi:hypothetical protein FRB90_002565 [Tulasnella sp. 427]|nr:hypothetical protein FRB90_002565 [Tulasnella sp. 427]